MVNQIKPKRYHIVIGEETRLDLEKMGIITDSYENIIKRLIARWKNTGGKKK